MSFLVKTELSQSFAMLFQHQRLHGKFFISIPLPSRTSFDVPNRFFNDTELKNSAKHKIEAKQNAFSLTINKCDHPDVGTYRVQVDNGIDHTEQTAKLNVGGTYHSC
jgi:hypothetical protein